jgi:PAS domain S-box-containing protein
MTLSRERLQRLVDRSTDIVVATSRDGTVVYYNDGASRSLGYRAGEVMGTFVGRLYPSKEEAKRVKDAMRSAEYGGGGIVESFPTTFVTKSGEQVPVAISGSIIYDEAGQDAGTIGFAKDLREIQHRDQLATLGEVAVGLSHEINNPLAVIVNQVDLLERELTDLAGERDCSVEYERLDAVRREVGRVSEIVSRLSEMAETDTYETVDYVGPARMVDLRTRRARGEDTARLAGVRILVADDDLGICKTMKEILESEGCSVETASDGEEALRRIADGHFDLVLSDVVMPKMDGYDLYKAILERQPGLPVLMMTAFHYDKDHIIKRSRMEGLEGVIFKKPVDPERLVQVIAEMVGRGKRDGPTS